METAKQTTPTSARQAVGRYYDKNTRGFLASGEGGKSLAIHRSIWGPGTSTAAQAAEYVPSLFLEQARATGSQHILDLGCGVGGTCLFLAEHLGRQGLGTGKPDTGTPATGEPATGEPATGEPGAAELHITGLTISDQQLQLGRKLVAQRGLDQTVELLQGDYTDPASFAGRPPQDLIVALESFIHSPDLPATLANAVAALKPGGRLLICDDMITNNIDQADRDLESFKRGWHAYGLSSREALAELCRRFGLELLLDEDLSPLLRLFRTRDRLAAVFLPLLRLFPSWPWAQNLVGGTALQRLLAKGHLSYRYQVWVKAG